MDRCWRGRGPADASAALRVAAVKASVAAFFPPSFTCPGSSYRGMRDRQLLLGHLDLESTVRYLGIEVDDALEMSELIEL